MDVDDDSAALSRAPCSDATHTDHVHADGDGAKNDDNDNDDDEERRLIRRASRMSRSMDAQSHHPTRANVDVAFGMYKAPVLVQQP